MIVVVGGIKGGCGKTTIATNLAVMRSKEKKVLLIDGDEQGSTSIWANQRHAQGLETKWSTIPLSGKAIYHEVLKMKSNYDDVIIDVGGRDTTSLRASLALCDLFIVPFKPRSLDVWTLGDIRLVISEMRHVNPTFKAFALINQADSKGSDNDEAISVLDEYEEIKCLSLTIGQRKSFANAAGDGLSVIEMKVPDKKAIAEIENLYTHIYT